MKDRTVRYVIHFVVDSAHWTPSEWRVRDRGQIPGYGSPTEANIRKHCEVVEASTQPDGPNAHLGQTKILRAWVVDQFNKKTVAEYTRAA